jgi:hypothetical protein
MSLYAFWRLLHDGGRLWWASHAILTGMLFHLHYYGGWLVLAENLFVIGWLWRREGPLWQRPAWRRWRVWLADQVVVLLLALPAFAVFYTKLMGHNQWDWLASRYSSPGLAALIDLFVSYTTGIAYQGPSLVRWVALALCGGLASWAVFRHARADEDRQGEGLRLAALALVLPVGLVFVLGQIWSVWVPRYLLLFLPAFLLLVARGLDTLGERLVTPTLLLLAGLCLWSLYGLYAEQQKEDWRGVARYIQAHGTRDDLLVLMDDECRVPFDYYYGQDGVRFGLSRFADAETLDRAAENIRQQDAEVWLIVSHADGSGLFQRLDQAETLERVPTPDFVGIELVRYVPQ